MTTRGPGRPKMNPQKDPIEPLFKTQQMERRIPERNQFTQRLTKETRNAQGSSSGMSSNFSEWKKNEKIAAVDFTKQRKRNATQMTY